MTTQPATAPEPPKRGRGQPRKLPVGTVRTTIRFPPAVLAELTAAATRAGRSVNDEVIDRCERPPRENSA